MAGPASRSKFELVDLTTPEPRRDQGLSNISSPPIIDLVTPEPALVVDLSTPEPDQLVAPVVDLSTPEPDQLVAPVVHDPCRRRQARFRDRCRQIRHLSYYGAGYERAMVAYLVQPAPAWLCDAIFRAARSWAASLSSSGSPTRSGSRRRVCRASRRRALVPLFPVARPELFDAVLVLEAGRIA